MVVLAVVYIVAGISLMAALFALRRCFRDPPPGTVYPYLVITESFRFGGTIFLYCVTFLHLHTSKKYSYEYTVIFETVII